MMRKNSIDGIVLPDLHLCVEIEDVKGTICAEQGMVVFYSPERGIVTPLGFSVPGYMYDEEVIAVLNKTTKKVYSCRPPYGKYADDMQENDYDIHDYNALSTLLDQYKISQVSTIIPFYLLTFFAVIGIIFSAITHTFISLVLCTLSLITAVVYARALSKRLNSQTIIDGEGNWVNLETGESSFE